MELCEIRKEIDAVDQELLALFLRRMALAEDVAAYKKAHDLPILNAQREAEILEAMGAQAGELAPYACQLFSTLFALSRTRQEALLHRGEL